jgi:xanthine dehydrogenase accessory factor
MRDEKSRTLSFALNERDYPDSGLLCGGQLEIFVEPIVVPQLVLFGGGHVSAAIARIAHMVGFHVTVVDDREAFATRERHPDADETRCAPFDELAQAILPADDKYVIAATRGHDKDGDVLRALHSAGAQPKYLGMIGSRAKRVQLFAQLREQGVGAEFLARVRTPMGLPIGARTHEEIAVAVVAEMVQLRRVGSGAENAHGYGAGPQGRPDEDCKPE